MYPKNKNDEMNVLFTKTFTLIFGRGIANGQNEKGARDGYL